MAGGTSTLCAAEPQELQPPGYQAACDSQCANESDRQKRPGRAHCEKCAAGQRADYLNRELHGLEHALGARLLAGVRHPAHLRVEARSARDRKHALDKAEPDQPWERRDEGIDRAEHPSA